MGGGAIIRTCARLLLSTRKLKCYFPPAAKLLSVFLFIFSRPQGVLSLRVFITSARLLNLQNTLLASYTPDPLPHHRRYRLACEDLLPGWGQGSMWRVGGVGRRGRTCCRIGPALSQGCLLSGRTEERRPHNRPIHHAATRTPESRSALEVSFPPRRAGQNLHFISKMVSSPRLASDWHVLDFFFSTSRTNGERQKCRVKFLDFLARKCWLRRWNYEGGIKVFFFF